MKYLLDTNICIYLIKKKPLHLLAKFQSIPLGDAGISSITLGELQYGVAKSEFPQRNQEALNKFTLPLEIVSFDSHAAMVYGKIRSQLEKQGTPIGPLDTLLAAHALSLNAVMVTNNIKEFERVDGLAVENWI